MYNSSMGTKEKFDFVVIGNGAIGLLSAIRIKENLPKMTVAIVGPTERIGSASAAAGAMANVFAEYESDVDGNYAAQDLFLKIGILGRDKWKKFLLSHNMNQVITVESTLVYLQKNASRFEILNFSKVKEISKNHDCLEGLTSDRIDTIFTATRNRIDEVIEIKNEFSICTKLLFELLSEHAKKIGVHLIDDYAQKLNSEDEIALVKGEVIQFKKLVIAAGAQSGNLLMEYHVVQMLQGVGTAVIFDSESTHELHQFKRNVIRTVNRGGAQCGIHLVPRSDGSLYLGAGNYVATPIESPHRIETIRYLFEKLESDIVGKQAAYDLTGTLTKGYRPRSLDGYPMIGPLKENTDIFVATATNRVGLTWAPEIAEQILLWANETEISKSFSDWKPDRKLISFGTPSKAKDYFVNSRIGAAIEHGLVDNDPDNIKKREIELRNISDELHVKTATLVGINSEFASINPDNWNAIISNNISCIN